VLLWFGDLHGGELKVSGTFFDDLNRLTTVDYIDATDEEFTYDKIGNRTGIQDLRIGTENYVVDPNTNRYDGVGGSNLTYDAAGNLTTDPNGYEYVYDYENRLIRIFRDTTDIAEYTYDALGIRSPDLTPM